MTAPPFRLAPTSGKSNPANATKPIGMFSPLKKACCTPQELIDQKRSTDLEIHHTAVALSTEGGAAGKAINKALDDRYVLALKRFKSIKDEAAVRAGWREAMESGDIPGAYWGGDDTPMHNDRAARLGIRPASAAGPATQVVTDMSGASVRAEARFFYQSFFGYSLTQAELDQILQVKQ